MVSWINVTVDVRGQRGAVVAWEPLGAALCDALVRFADGSECWFASHELRPAGEHAGLRMQTRAEADARTLASLRTIRERHVAEWGRRWPGAEFGKAIVGKAIDNAIESIKEGR